MAEGEKRQFARRSSSPFAMPRCLVRELDLRFLETCSTRRVYPFLRDSEFDVFSKGLQESVRISWNVLYGQIEDLFFVEGEVRSLLHSSERE